MTVTSFRPLLTAFEAYPALEEMFLGAEEEIRASFRIFDLATRLRSHNGRQVGRDWFDLIVHLLNRGVHITIVLADFDPIFAPGLHRRTWRSMRQFACARECARAGRLTVRAEMHPARAGWLARYAVWPMALSALGRTVRDLNTRERQERLSALAEMPGLRPRLAVAEGSGQVRRNGVGVPQLIPATHHQKLAVVDRRQLFIGGLDLDERRYDDPAHARPSEDTWHDVASIVEGPVVADAQHHLEHFLDPDPEPAALPDGSSFLRTVSTLHDAGPPLGLSPRVAATEILEAHERLFGMARHLIYAETQFLRDHGLADSLAAAGRRNSDLTVILMLPAAPEDVAFENARGLDARYGELLQAECIEKLRRAFGERLFVGAPAKARPAPANDDPDGTGRDTAWRAPIVYIHSKVTIADDRAAILSSANLNGRSLRWDTEAGIWLERADHVGELRRRCFDHWLEGEETPELFDPETAQRAWATLAERNAQTPPRQRRRLRHPL